MGSRLPLGPILALVVVGGLLLLWTWKPSSTGIAKKLQVDEAGMITLEEHRYETEWGETEEIRGHLRVKERHYDKNIPILTWTFLVTTGEYTDPELVDITSYGGGNFRWKAPREPKGTLVGYHLVPATPAAEQALRAIDEGSEIFLEGKLSTSSKITSTSGAFLQLMHSNHKFVLVEAAGILE